MDQSLILFTVRNILHIDHATGKYHTVLFQKLGDPLGPIQFSSPVDFDTMPIDCHVVMSCSTHVDCQN